MSAFLVAIEQHRQRRPRRECFGELVQMDTSIHDWLEGRGEAMVLIAMIDDATSRVHAGFYPAETLEGHFDLLRRCYPDRYTGPKGQTQFGRALKELAIDRTTAYSPQAK
jgi:hypothetical protein